VTLNPRRATLGAAVAPSATITLGLHDLDLRFQQRFLHAAICRALGFEWISLAALLELKC